MARRVSPRSIPVRDKVFWLLRPAGFYRWVLRPIFELVRDLTLGLDTARRTNRRIAYRADEVEYYPSSWGALRKVLPLSSVTSEDVLLDVGCGKGVVLCAALAYPFGRMIGVEMSRELCQVAQRNVRRMNKTNVSVDVLNVDAAHYVVPSDVTVVYLFNPLVDDLFDDFLDRLMQSLQARPRLVRIVYNNPVMHDAVIARGFSLDRVEKFITFPPTRIHLYSRAG